MKIPHSFGGACPVCRWVEGMTALVARTRMKIELHFHQFFTPLAYALVIR